MKKQQTLQNITSLDSKNFDLQAETFIDFLRGGRSAKVHRFFYQDSIVKTDVPSGIDSWDAALGKKQDYYIFANEAYLIRKYGVDIAKAAQYNAKLIELGPGSEKAITQKTLPLMQALKPQSYVAADLSLAAITDAQRLCQTDFPSLKVKIYKTDFFSETSDIFQHKGTVLMTGSTISNIPSYDGQVPVNGVVDLLRKIGTLLPPSGSLIITQDTNLDETSLKTAYTTPAMEQFWGNGMHRMKESLGIKSLDISALKYDVIWEKQCNLLALTYINTKDQKVHVQGTTVHIPKGQRLYITNSYRYPVNDFLHMSRIAGLEPVQTWMDSDDRVALHVLNKSDHS